MNFGVNNRKYTENVLELLNTMKNWHELWGNFYIAFDVTNIKPLKLLDIPNNIHNNIQFTMEHNQLYLPFLDIMVNKDPETKNIWMDILYKKTDTWICVPFNSCYPKQCKNNIHFTLVRWIYNIVENSKVRKNFWMNFKKFYIPKNIHKI